MTVGRILCPIDFSQISAHALDHAIVLARRAGAHLTVLHVFLSVMPRTGVEGLDAATAQVIDPADLQDLQDRAAALCRPAIDAGVKVDKVIVGGAPVPTILAHAAASKANLIVMGTHGAGGFQHLLLGSVTEKVLRKAPCPVLTVPPRAQGTPAASFTRVLCAVDLASDPGPTVAAAAAMVEGATARLTLLHVLEWPWHEPPVPPMPGLPAEQARALLEYRRYLESSASEKLERMASAIEGCEVTTAIRFGKAYGEILDTTRELRADLVVLGVRGRSAVDIGFFGSTANHVVRSATCPVLTVRG
jgi:nucleotide-binding universal stress UspA family protein